MVGRQQREAVHKIILLEGFSVHGIICNEINHWEIKFWMDASGRQNVH